MTPVEISTHLSGEVSQLQFASPVTHVYNPIEYAARPHHLYLERYGNAPRDAILIGMNPGPFGMAQIGVPFGEVTMVRDWLGIHGPVGKPLIEHPKRPIVGFACPRSEVSGARLWGWARDRFLTPERFFARFFVWNYCPLCFMESSGANRTPDKLPAAERIALYAACDRALQALIAFMAPQFVIGVGKFGEERARVALPEFRGVFGCIPHPSPANPNANRGWAAAAEKALTDLGVSLE